MSKIKDIYYEVGYKVNDEGIKKADENVQNLTNDIQSMVGKAAGIAAVGVAFNAVKNNIVESVKMAADFDNSLRSVAAKVGVGSEGMGMLGDVALGVSTKYGVAAKDVASAQNYLALAGFTNEQILKATEKLVSVQIASGESMAVVSDIITDVSTAYGYSADELGKVGDMAVYTSSKFNTSVGQLGEAYKYVVPIAKNAGLGLNDLNSYLGVLSNNLIKGSQAGTVMRAAVTRITAPTKEAASQMKRFGIEAFEKGTGKFKGFNEVMTQIQKALPKMTDKQRAMFMQTVFGQEAISGLNVIFGEGVDKVTDYGNAIDKSTGKSEQMAKFMNSGLEGSINKMNTSFSKTQIIVGGIFSGISSEGVEDVTKATDKLNKSLENGNKQANDFLTGIYLSTSTGAKAIFSAMGGFVSNTADLVNLTTGNFFKNIAGGTGDLLTSGFTEIGERRRAEKLFLSETLPGGNVTDISGQFSPTINLTLNNNGGIINKETTDLVKNELEGMMNDWRQKMFKSEMNRLR
ncbi:MAG: phage tail tape measure protein [Cetobacterium sp.]|uniref:phage tail tape measure protein n=1 Tax=Cetobacterium sp. TaxID=2071632 RepID=UPI003F3FAD1E